MNTYIPIHSWYKCIYVYVYSIHTYIQTPRVLIFYGICYHTIVRLSYHFYRKKVGCPWTIPCHFLFCITSRYITWHSWYIYIHIYPRDGMFYIFLWLSYHHQTNDLRRWKGTTRLFCNSVCFYGVCYRTIIAYQYHVHPTNKYIYTYSIIYIYTYTLDDIM